LIDLDPILTRLENLPWGPLLRESDWAFPAVESVHVVAITLVVGSIAIVDLRLLGLASRQTRVTDLTRDVLPWTWGLFAVAAVSGLTLFTAKAHAYVADMPFKLKMVCLVLAGLNMAAFHLTIDRSVERWTGPGPTPAAAKAFAAVSLCLWITIVGLGRWIGFTIIG
jgi:hypothetical protein